jgi:hypothetical protein
MADSIRLEIVGLREMAIGLDHWGDDVEAASRQALETQLALTVEDLQRAAPVGRYRAWSRREEGTLQRSISGRLDATGMSARIRVGARHAHLVEFGHQGPAPAPAHPWFVPIVVRARAAWYGRLKAAIERIQAPGVGPGTAEVRER